MYGRNSKLISAAEKPPWKPWAMSGLPHNSNVIDKGGILRNPSKREISNAYHQPSKLFEVPYNNKKHVSFKTEEKIRPPKLSEHLSTLQLAESIKRKNLSVSKPLRHQFKTKLSERFMPEMKHFSETYSSYKKPWQMTESLHDNKYYSDNNASTTNVRNSSNGFLNGKQKPSTIRNKHTDRDIIKKVTELKSRILAGERVSLTDITAAKENAMFPHGMSKYRGINSKIRSISNVKGNEMHKDHTKKIIISLRPLFCDKGIVNVPHPHNGSPLPNSFGSPADLRISLSNSDTAEFKGRRRWFFYDYTGFDDSEIKLYLEGTDRFVVIAERPHRYDQVPVRISNHIDLPNDITVDNLRVVRDPFGTLIVEEAWKF